MNENPTLRGILKELDGLDVWSESEATLEAVLGVSTHADRHKRLPLVSTRGLMVL
jgi:hypothetical protein